MEKKNKPTTVPDISIFFVSKIILQHLYFWNNFGQNSYKSSRYDPRVVTDGTAVSTGQLNLRLLNHTYWTSTVSFIIIFINLSFPRHCTFSTNEKYAIIKFLEKSSRKDSHEGTLNPTPILQYLINSLQRL